MPRPMVVLTGRRFGRLLVVAQAADTFSPSNQRKRNWLAICDCGTEKVISSIALAQGHSRSCGCLLRESNSSRRAIRPTYQAFHTRQLRDRGSARAFACVDCGGAAEQWSYNHADPSELHEAGIAYSIDPDFYEPRCQPCHRRFDHRASKRRAL